MTLHTTKFGIQRRHQIKCTGEDVAPSVSDAMKPSAGYSTILEESKVRTFRLFRDLVAQKYHAVFEPGGLEQLQVLPILEKARSLAA
jgi:hypothetical protein